MDEPVDFNKLNAWVSVKKVVPKDDQTVFVINNKLDMLPTKCYFSAESQEFICVESLAALPVSATHWMHLPERPKG